jgi:hypothetical protein
MKSVPPDLFAVFIAATAFCGFGVPSFTPLDFVAANPNRVRSEINSLSRWATNARIPTVNRFGVRRTFRAVDLDARTVETPSVETERKDANQLNSTDFSNSVCEDVWEWTC